MKSSSIKKAGSQRFELLVVFSSCLSFHITHFVIYWINIQTLLKYDVLENMSLQFYYKEK